MTDSFIDSPNRHIPSLDGLRGIAILLVLLFHLEFVQGEGVVTNGYVFAAGLGWCGVDLFFVLSGFLITGILVHMKGTARYFRNFYARRALRILPLYYGMLVLAQFLLPAVSLNSGVDLDRFWPWFWSYIPNFLMIAEGKFVGGPFLSVTWSLAIEEQFYLIWPILVFYCPKKLLLKISGFVVVGSLAIRLILLQQGVPALTLYVHSLLRLDGLAFGSMLAVLLPSCSRTHTLKVTRFLLAGSMLGLAIVLYTARSSWWGTAPMLGWGHTVLTVFFGSLLVLAVAEGSGFFNTILNSGFLKYLGKYSYGIYFFHYPLYQGMNRVSLRDRIFEVLGSLTLSSFVAVALTFCLSLAVAHLSYHLFEKHFLKLKRYFSHAPSPSAISSSGEIRTQISESTDQRISSGSPR